MANAKKCDRCGAFYEYKANPIIKVEIDYHYQGIYTFDLCPRCIKELKKWLNIKEVEDEKV